MSKRYNAEAMYGNALWQVVSEDLLTGRRSIVEKNLSIFDAYQLLGKLQREADEPAVGCPEKDGNTSELET
jgi:hypothetical protein